MDADVLLWKAGGHRSDTRIPKLIFDVMHHCLLAMSKRHQRIGYILEYCYSRGIFDRPDSLESSAYLEQITKVVECSCYLNRVFHLRILIECSDIPESVGGDWEYADVVGSLRCLQGTNPGGSPWDRDPEPIPNLASLGADGGGKR